MKEEGTNATTEKGENAEMAEPRALVELFVCDTADSTLRDPLSALVLPILQMLNT